jgi:hypothetical protein
MLHVVRCACRLNPLSLATFNESIDFERAVTSPASRTAAGSGALHARFPGRLIAAMLRA